jgi:hypothetical protein
MQTARPTVSVAACRLACAEVCELSTPSGPKRSRLSEAPRAMGWKARSGPSRAGEAPAALPAVLEAALPAVLEAALPAVLEAALPAVLEAALPAVLEAALPAVLEAALLAVLEAALPAVLEAAGPGPPRVAGEEWGPAAVVAVVAVVAAACDQACGRARARTVAAASMRL